MQLLFRTSFDSLFPSRPLLLDSPSSCVPGSPDEYTIWVPLGHDFLGRFRVQYFLGSTVDAVRSSVLVDYVIFHTLSTCSRTSDPGVGRSSPHRKVVRTSGRCTFGGSAVGSALKVVRKWYALPKGSVLVGRVSWHVLIVK